MTDSQTTLSAEIAPHLEAFVAAAQHAFQDDLCAIVLYGSAADGQMRATSDVNLLLLLRRFAPGAADALRESMLVAHAAIDLQVMFLLEAELPAAMEAFAVKFSDIIDRHRVLYGPDPFVGLHTARGALLLRLNQVLLNQQLRMRERYVLVSLREEQLVPAIADAAGPLRAAAASLAHLDSGASEAGKPALERFVRALGQPALDQALRHMSAAREGALLAPGLAGATFIGLIEIAEQLRARVAQME
ncbi:MAG: hypothetical protein V4754_02655 [Pseudomonadota bacterium]